MFFNSIKEINRLRKEINWLLSKGIFLIQLKKQEMPPSRQQKSATKGPKIYLLNGPNFILMVLRFDDGRTPEKENDRRWFF